MLDLNKYIGEKVKINGSDYEISKAESLEKYEHLARGLIEHDKVPAQFYASKILKSGKLSAKQCFLMYRFNCGKYIKIF